MDSKNQYRFIYGKTDPIFFSKDETYLKILQMSQIDQKTFSKFSYDEINKKFQAKQDDVTKKWYIEWKILNPHYN